MLDTFKSSTPYSKSLCGRAWVESRATSKPSQVPTNSTDICAPCGSVPAEQVDDFCTNNGNNKLVGFKNHFMCAKDPCVRKVDAPKCCACGRDNGLSVNAAPCACGKNGAPNLCPDSNMYCNQAAKICAHFSVPTCTHTKGLKENPSSCACGASACESTATTGLYCTASKSDCRKYPICIKGEGREANTANCTCGSEDCTGGSMFCYEPLGQCKPDKSSFTSGNVIGPVCDSTDGASPHTSTDSCVCGKTGACTSSSGLTCYAPTSTCQLLPNSEWLQVCNSTDDTQPNNHSCVCGVKVCAPSVNGPYCLSSASR